jgi:hypothetical protein
MKSLELGNVLSKVLGYKSTYKNHLSFYILLISKKEIRKIIPFTMAPNVKDEFI